MSTAYVRIPLPTAPVVSAIRGTVAWSVQAVTFAVSAPLRLATLLTSVEGIVAEIQRILAVTIDVIDTATEVTARIDGVSSRADALIEGAEDLLRRTEKMIAQLEPISDKLTPYGTLIADSIDEQEVRAVISMIDQLPELAERADALMPILATMESVAPELHQLLMVTEDLRQAVVGLPGFKFLRGRGQARLEEGDDGEHS